MSKPKLIISSLDVVRLEKLLDGLSNDQFQAQQSLLDELDRADIRSPQEMPGNVVTMNSTVQFKVVGTEEEFSLKLVYPQDSGNNGDTISILAPVGSALLGLSEGDSINWPKPGGGEMTVEIIKLTHQPEREGEFTL